MSNFKIGQKLVFIGDTEDDPHDFNNPQYNEIVTVSEISNLHGGSVVLVEYPLTKCGHMQVWQFYDFKELDCDFADKIINNLLTNKNK